MTRSYRDVLARSERQRSDGSGPVWPLRAQEIGLFTPAASVTRPPSRRPQLRAVEAGVELTGESGRG